MQHSQKPPVSNSQVTYTGIETIMSLVFHICHLRIVLLPPLATKARGGAWVLKTDPQLPSDTAMLLSIKNSGGGNMMDVEMIG
jgi:hypothetical protein